MPHALVICLCLLIAAAGWYYLFYSRAASSLAGLEHDADNLRRARLRRVGGAFMLILGALMYAALTAIDWRTRPHLFVYAWLAVMMNLLIIVILAAIDLRLTWKMRQRRRLKDS